MSSYSNFAKSSFVDPDYLQTLTTVFYVTSSVSLVANLLVCLFHGFMAVCQVAELNRVSLRLIVFACASGVIFSAFRFAMIIPADTDGCSVDSFFIVCTDLASPFCLSMVGVHAVCVLVLNVKDPRRLEKYYYFVIFIYSIVVSVVAVAASPANYPERYPCWIRHYFGKKDLQRFNWIWYYSLLVFPIALSALCSLVLLIRYSMERHNFATTSVRYARNNNPFLIPVISRRSNTTDPIKTFRDVIIRSTFYTLRFTNIQGYNIGGRTLIAAGVITTLQGEMLDSIRSSFLIGPLFPPSLLNIGFLVSILYFTDPAVRYTFGRFFRFLRKVYVDDYDLPPAKLNEPSPPSASPSIDDMWVSRYDEGDTWIGDKARGATVRLTRVNHDMIAEDTLEDGTANDHQQSKHQLATLFVRQQPWNPYRCRCFAKAMHWFLTKVCRLKPRAVTAVSPTSTLSYHSQPLTNTPTTQCSTPSSLGIDKQVSSSNENLSSTSDFALNSSNEGSTDKTDTPISKKRIPTVQFDSPSLEHRRLRKKVSGSPTTATSSPIYATTDDARYLTPYNTQATQRHPSFSATHESLQPTGSSLFTPPLRWHPPSTSDQDISSDSPASSTSNTAINHSGKRQKYHSSSPSQPP
ncbi:hypothetical protein [Absidia glauca]|uniref:Uncharacterized protein n=1 Tax=Absidia glauca TaxID=4829 RepID=A0A168LW42_ABSGL|nr:hypothetical protein [Absidia glauca]